jgi:hypothetical protein
MMGKDTAAPSALVRLPGLVTFGGGVGVCVQLKAGPLIQLSVYGGSGGRGSSGCAGEDRPAEDGEARPVVELWDEVAGAAIAVEMAVVGLADVPAAAAGVFALRGEKNGTTGRLTVPDAEPPPPLPAEASEAPAEEPPPPAPPCAPARLSPLLAAREMPTPPEKGPENNSDAANESKGDAAQSLATTDAFCVNAGSPRMEGAPKLIRLAPPPELAGVSTVQPG